MDALPDATARVFFALWPSEAVQTALQDHGKRLRAQVGGNLTRRESIHLTLVFLGEVERVRLELAGAAAARTAFESFDLRIDSAGCWKHNRIAWLAPGSTPLALQRLATDLKRGLDEAGLHSDQRPYVPHITLLRKAHCAELEPNVAPVSWRVEDFVLVESARDAAGSRYRVLGRWPQNIARSFDEHTVLQQLGRP